MTARGKLRVGVVGAGGFVGRAHVEAIRRTGLADVAVVSASTPESARAAADRLHVADAAATLDELLDAVDVVHNCTPTPTHAEVALAVLEAGRPLVTEKPLASTVADAEAIADAAEAAGVPVALCHNYRYLPMVQEARALVAEGAIGTPHLVHGHYLQDWLTPPGVRSWRLSADGGMSTAFADIGTHWCDLAMHVLGRPIVEVDARLGGLHGRPLDDHGALLARFQGGVLASVVVSQASPGHKNRLVLKVDGDDGSITWNQERPDELVVGRVGAPNEDVRKAPSMLRDAARPYAHLPQGHVEGWGTSFKNLFLDLYTRVLGETPPSPDVLPTPGDGLALVRLVEAVVRSSREERPVSAVEVPA